MPSAESRLRGVFPVLQSPFDDANRLDLDALGAEVEFCRRAGVHGVVYPAIASEFQYLTDDERRAGVEAVVGAAAGAIPVVAGVAAASGAQVVVYAAHAARAGATAVMALPPIISPGRADELRAYYAGIAAGRRAAAVRAAFPGGHGRRVSRGPGARHRVRALHQRGNASERALHQRRDRERSRKARWAYLGASTVAGCSRSLRVAPPGSCPRPIPSTCTCRCGMPGSAATPRGHATYSIACCRSSTCRCCWKRRC